MNKIKHSKIMYWFFGIKSVIFLLLTVVINIFAMKYIKESLWTNKFLFTMIGFNIWGLWYVNFNLDVSKEVGKEHLQNKELEKVQEK